jgi:DNA repair protein RadC
LKASDADIKITKKIKLAAESLDITILDHLIITEHGYLSFSDEGIL